MTDDTKVDQSRLISVAALPDDRPASAKAKDYLARETATAAIAPFQNPKPTKVGATEYNQWYVGSCVPHGFCTQLEYEGIIPAGGLSQLRAYRKRSNYPQAGSIGPDIYEKIKAGQTTNVDFPTQPQMSEEMATAMKLVVGEKLISDFKYFQYVDPQGNLDLKDVPSDIASGKAVAIFIYATEEEWSQQYVQIKTPNLQPNSAYVRHCICLIPRGDFTENGKQYLTVQDSAKFGGLGMRYLTYEFFQKRVYFAAKVYKAGAVPPPPPPPVPVKPTKACKKGDRNQIVTDLQNYLVQGKYLEPQYVSGYYGALTATAVLWWQLFHHEKFDINIPALLALKGESFGDKSLAVVKIIG